MAAERNISRPDPGQFLIAATADDGAYAWVKGQWEHVRDDPALLASLMACMDDAHQTARDKAASELRW